MVGVLLLLTGVLLQFGPRGVDANARGPDLRSPDHCISRCAHRRVSAMGRRHRLGVKSPLAHPARLTCQKLLRLGGRAASIDKSRGDVRRKAR